MSKPLIINRLFCTPEIMAARFAVLLPLAGKVPWPSDPAARHEHERLTGIVHKMWRTRISTLYDSEWQAITGKLGVYPCSYCNPIGLVSTHHKRWCHQTTVCPWSYGREDVRVYRGFSNILSDSTSIEPLTLYGFRTSLHDSVCNARLSLKQMLKSDRKRWHCRTSALQPAAGYLQLVAEPVNKSAWSVRRVGLMLLGRDVKLPHWFGDVFITREYPDIEFCPWKLAWFVGRVMRYPRHLMTCRPSKFMRLVKARQGIRASATYGLMRSLPRYALDDV